MQSINDSIRWRSLETPEVKILIWWLEGMEKHSQRQKIDPKLSTSKRGVQIMPHSSSSWKGFFHGYHIHVYAYLADTESREINI